MSSAVTVRPATLADVDAVVRIQAQSYPEGLHESADVMRSHLAAVGGHNLVATMLTASDNNDAEEEEEAEVVLGYCLAHPWRREDGVPQLFDAIPTSFIDAVEDGGCAIRDKPFDTLFLHDIAVSPEARGKSVAKLLMEAALRAAPPPSPLVENGAPPPSTSPQPQQQQEGGAGYSCAMLVAVQGAEMYWKRFGFEEQQQTAGESSRTSDGGGGAADGLQCFAGSPVPPVVMLRDLP